MATWDDVERIACGLPEVEEAPTYEGNRSWKVRGKLVVWQRPLRRKDLEELGDDAPDGQIAGVRTPDLDVREQRLAEMAPHVFVTSHFDGYSALLVDVDRIDLEDLRELITDSWLRQAPRTLVTAFLSGPPE